MYNILVCDDDRAIADALEIYLKQEGYKVHKAYDGLEALKIVDEKEIHLIILDIMMPGLDGFFSSYSPEEIVAVIGVYFIWSIDLSIGLSYILSMVRHIKNKSLFRHTLIYAVASTVFKFIKLCFNTKAFRFTLLLFLLTYGFINSILFAVLVNSEGFPQFMAFMLITAFNAAALFFTAKALLSLSSIMGWVKEVSKGNLEDVPDTRNMSAAFAGFASDIRNIQAGLKEAVSLTMQAMAEYNDRAADAGLDMRMKTTENVPVILGDGKLMWRIMDNLLSNVVKYSQRNSRVYVDIGNTGTHGVITIKNISANALDIPVEQLLERFVRGDRSRTTEGSGLGLSIARSLTEIQGGKLDVSIDGDLFKVSVYMPLITKN